MRERADLEAEALAPEEDGSGDVGEDAGEADEAREGQPRARVVKVLPVRFVATGKLEWLAPGAVQEESPHSLL